MLLNELWRTSRNIGKISRNIEAYQFFGYIVLVRIRMGAREVRSKGDSP